jgi:hypothetical protein
MFSITIINTILELVVAMLPIPVILSLSMKRRDRWSAISVLCLGVVVFTAGCVRCWVVYQALLGTFDSTWWSGPQWICSEVENNIALVSSGFNVITAGLTNSVIDMRLRASSSPTSRAIIGQENKQQHTR